MIQSRGIHGGCLVASSPDSLIALPGLDCNEAVRERTFSRAIGLFVSQPQGVHGRVLDWMVLG